MGPLKILFVAITIVLVACDKDVSSVHSIFKRTSAELGCKGGAIPVTLCEGYISKSTETEKTIGEEANENPSSKLYEAFHKLIDAPYYSTMLAYGRKSLLSEMETQAVYLYRMDSIGLFDELNAALREGEDKYPILHYWFQNALQKLPKGYQSLYRGLSGKVDVNIGNKIRLPGFTSTSMFLNVGKSSRYTSPGCTILEFDFTRQGGSVSSLEPGFQSNIVIPPSEIFRVYNKTFDGEYHFIHLTPSTVNKRSTSVFTLCNPGNVNTFSPLLLVLVCLQTIPAFI